MTTKQLVTITKDEHGFAVLCHKHKEEFYFIGDLNLDWQFDLKLQSNAISGQFKKVESLIHLFDECLLFKDIDWKEAFCKGCEGGNLKVIDLLEKYGACNYIYGLIGACKAGHLHIAYRMLKKGVTKDALNFGLLLASWRGRTSVVRLLIDNGAVELQEALEGAISHNHEFLAHYLIRRMDCRRTPIDWRSILIEAEKVDMTSIIDICNAMLPRHFSGTVLYS